MFARLRAAESIGRPLGDERFLTRLERLTKRSLKTFRGRVGFFTRYSKTPY
ncbi:hypothetical protein [Bradyrhizobium japonicum]|uniref:hypothetical protein n=1 Tax=Bradyrhizobium japonicum TaxID=375 RepID=UPI000AADDED9|nr:hypothetical protein [Bradyrhizobium japonicum]